MNIWLVIGFVLVIALFGAAGTQFILAHLGEQKRLRTEDAAMEPAARWRRFRFPHRAIAAARRPQHYYRRVIYGFGFLLAGLVLFAFLQPSL